MSDFLWPHGLKHARPPCPSPNPRVYWNSCPSSWWCHPTISFSCHPLFLLPSPCPLAFYLSQHQGLFKWVSSSHHVAKVLELQHEYSGLIFFRTDCFDLAIQGTFKSPLQHHSSKASFLQRSVFFIVQLSHPYMTTEKTTALTIWTFRCWLYEQHLLHSC